MDNTGRILFSVRLWHPFFSVDEITKQIQKEPSTSQSAGENLVTPKGRKINRINKETYVVYDLPINSYDLADAIRVANNFLFENIDFFNKLKQTGGRCDYFITIDQQKGNSFPFEITSELFKDCSKLDISLGVEIYPPQIIKR